VLVKPVDRRHTLEVMPDHVHLFVESDPTLCVGEIVNRLKGFASHQLREELPFSVRACLLSGAAAYYAASVGSVSEAVVREYIENQKGK
jgi:putative transposase